MQIRQWIGVGVVAAVTVGALFQVTACAKPEAATKPAGQEGNVKIHVFDKQCQLVGPI